MSEYIKISDVIKICKSLSNSNGTTAFFGAPVPVFENLLRTVAVEFPEPPKEDDAEWIDNKCSVCGKGIENLIESSEWYENEKPNYYPFCGIRL